MSFEIFTDVFKTLPTLCIGVVAVRGIDNTKPCPRIEALLAEAQERLAAELAGKNVKEHPGILPYREAFKTLGMNPNKFMPSIEALATRIAKGKGVPSISPVVDLGNAISLKYLLPLGAHPLFPEDEFVRFAQAGDSFLPFGATEPEAPDIGELIYANGANVGTRRWIWRQSERSKIEPETTDVFFPLDGFADSAPAILAAMDELAALCTELFGAQVVAKGLTDAASPRLLF